MPLGRGESEKELGAIRDQLGALDSRSSCHGLRQPGAAVEAPALEALADTRQLQHPGRRLEEAARPIGDVCPVIAPKEKDNVVVLENGVTGVAREAGCTEEGRCGAIRALRRTPVDREVPVGERRNEAAKVRQAPRGGDGKPCRGDRVAAFEVAQGPLEGALRLEEVGAARLHPELRGHDLVVQRRLDHLDALVLDDLHPRQQVLFGRPLEGLGPLGRVGQLVDELVDPRCPERPGSSTAEQLLPCESHD